MSATVATKVLLQLLLATVTPATAKALANLILDMLERMADGTPTDIDDQLVQLARRFLEAPEQQDPGA